MVGGYGGVDGHGTGGVWSCVWEHLEWFGIWEGGQGPRSKFSSVTREHSVWNRFGTQPVRRFWLDRTV